MLAVSGEPDQERMAAYYRVRDALSLSLRTASGELVETRFIHILDLEEEIGELQVERVAEGADAHQLVFPSHSGE
jgi:hypothetical protein